MKKVIVAVALFVVLCSLQVLAADSQQIDVTANAVLDGSNVRARAAIVSETEVSNIRALAQNRVQTLSARANALRAKSDVANEKVAEIRRMSKEEIKAVKDACASQQNCPELLTKSKERLTKILDALILRLEHQKEKVDIDPYIADDESSAIVATIDAKIAEATALKTRIEAATTLEELRVLKGEVTTMLHDFNAKYRRLLFWMHAERWRTTGVLLIGWSNRLERYMNTHPEMDATLKARITQLGVDVDSLHEKAKALREEIKALEQLDDAKKEEFNARFDAIKEEAKRLKAEIKEIIRAIKGVTEDSDIDNALTPEDVAVTG